MHRRSAARAKFSSSATAQKAANMAPSIFIISDIDIIIAIFSIRRVSISTITYRTTSPRTKPYASNKRVSRMTLSDAPAIHLSDCAQHDVLDPTVDQALAVIRQKDADIHAWVTLAEPAS